MTNYQHLSLAESLRIEHSLTTPVESLQSITSKIRGRLFRGDTLSTAQVVNEYGCSHGLLSITLKELRALGYTFKEGTESLENGQVVTTSTMENPTHWPEAELFDRVTRARTMRQQGRKKKPKGREIGDVEETKERVKVGRKPHKPPLPALPQLGTTLTVTMLSIDPDTGLARMGLQNGTVAWTVTIDTQVGR